MVKNPPAYRTKIDFTAEERQKIRVCLDLLQEAQSLAESAAESLCSVRGFADIWADTDRHNCIKARRRWIDARRRALEDRGVATCPKCREYLPADGSCCDYCDWTAPT